MSQCMQTDKETHSLSTAADHLLANSEVKTVTGVLTPFLQCLLQAGPSCTESRVLLGHR